jgi:hypothetical protein
MTIEFENTIFYWRGPSPFYFVSIPTDQSDDIKAIANRVTYGWGVVPVDVQIGNTTWYTALIPKDGHYLVPLKAVIRKAEKLEEGDMVSVIVDIREAE